VAFIETARPSLPSIPGKAEQYLGQYKSIPQTLASNNVPAISGTTGLGTGGGAGTAHMPTNGANGQIDVYLGPGFSQSLTVALTFPSAPPTLKWASNLGTFSVANAGQVFTLTFSAVIGIARSVPYKISWQPATAS
jgi:hypothetical protein